MRIGLAGVGRIGASHASTLAGLAAVEELVLADADPARARALAKELDVEAASTVADLLDSGIEGLVIAAATDAHAELILLALEAGVPTFCEKPVATDLERTLAVRDTVAGSDVPVQIGFQRRFDAGYRAARDAVAGGSLGWVHTIKAQTIDATPPQASYIPTSGGLFRDCSVHDFDIVRFVTGREVVSAYATGANRGEAFFGEAGDVDAAAALLVLDDGTNVLVAASRYNARGHDIRFEALGSLDSVAVGMDDRMPLRSLEDGVTFPGGTPYVDFMDRFGPAYAAELGAFTEVVAGRTPSPCTVDDALQAFRVAEACEISRREARIVRLDEVAGA